MMHSSDLRTSNKTECMKQHITLAGSADAHNGESNAKRVFACSTNQSPVELHFTQSFSILHITIYDLLYFDAILCDFFFQKLNTAKIVVRDIEFGASNGV